MPPRSDLRDLEAQVRATEQAFARTMADRDFEAFGRFLAADAVFFAGEKPIRGKAQIAGAWQPFFEGEGAPFSWSPETVVVLETGELALSSGPVRDPAGKVIARFQSIWRRGSEGRWEIVFDKGNDVCASCDP